MTGILDFKQNRNLKIAVVVIVLLLVVYIVINHTDLLNNKNINSFEDVTETPLEFEMIEDIIPVINTELIDVKIRYRNIHTNPENIYFDLTKVEHSDNNVKYYPSERNNQYSKLAIVHQNNEPASTVLNMVLKNVPMMDGLVDSEVIIHNADGDLKNLDNGTNLIQKGDVITLKLKMSDAFQGALFDYKSSNKFFMVINFSMNNNTDTYEQNILKTKPIKLEFKKNIYYSFGLVTTDNNDSIIKRYVSRVNTNKPLTVYSNEIGKNELHSIELVKSNTTDVVMWDNQTNNQGYLLRSLNDDVKKYYKINSNGEMQLTFSDVPFDLLNFERTASGLYNISTVKDNLYANNDFKFIVQRDEYGRFRDMNSDEFVEVKNLILKKIKEIYKIL